MTPTPLSSKARRHLKALGHHLTPVILVGKDGITSSLVEATKTALRDHELIKVKLGENAAGDRHALSDELAAQAQAHMIGLIGRMFLLYRRHPNKPTIELPKEKVPKASVS